MHQVEPHLRQARRRSATPSRDRSGRQHDLPPTSGNSSLASNHVCMFMAAAPAEATAEERASRRFRNRADHSLTPRDTREPAGRLGARAEGGAIQISGTGKGLTTVTNASCIDSQRAISRNHWCHSCSASMRHSSRCATGATLHSDPTRSTLASCTRGICNQSGQTRCSSGGRLVDDGT